MNAKQFIDCMEDEVRNLVIDYEHALTMSQRDANRDTEPGQPVPIVKRLNDKQGEWYDTKAEAACDRLKAALEQLRADEVKSVAEAPSAEAAATMQVLALRKNVSYEELKAYYEAYGSNYSVARALSEIAKENGYGSFAQMYAPYDYQAIERAINGLRRFEVEGHGTDPKISIKLQLGNVKSALGIESESLFF